MKQVVLTLALLLLAAAAWAQFTVTGTVVATEDGLPLSGVNVIEKGKSNGTVTRNDGTFELQVASENAVLVFSFQERETKEVEVKGQQTLLVKLKALNSIRKQRRGAKSARRTN